LDESILIQRAISGDGTAWFPLVRAHQNAVFRLSYLLLGDPDDAEDVTQETFLRAWNHLKRFDTTRQLRPWLLSIASNLASNKKRAVGRYFSALTRAFRNEPPTPNMEDKSLQRMQANELWQAVQLLNTADQQTVYMRYFLGLSVAETAEVLQVAEGTIKSRLSRALDKLRKIIQKDFPTLVEGQEP